MPDQAPARPIIAALEAARPVLSEKLVVEMYADPFWEARFGAIGRAFAYQDARYHVDNLIVALRFEMLESPFNHYCWLRNVLVKRGMCTRHLRQTIEALGRLLAAEMPAGLPEIQPYLQAGLDGLAYEHPACRALAAQEAAIAADLAERLGLDAGALLLTLSYLQDAIEENLPGLFYKHIAWLAAAAPPQGRPLAELRREAHLLAGEISCRLPPAQAAPFLDMLNTLEIP